MDISRDEQRVLHALAQGGRLLLLKDGRGRIERFELYTRDGWLLPVMTAEVFRKLRRKRAIVSHEGRPYQITRRGLELVRSEFDNR